jgi:hypothetical protein
MPRAAILESAKTDINPVARPEPGTNPTLPPGAPSNVPHVAPRVGRPSPDPSRNPQAPTSPGARKPATTTGTTFGARHLGAKGVEIPHFPINPP